jgi:Fuc2NAc and GlcNAc transferase
MRIVLIEAITVFGAAGFITQGLRRFFAELGILDIPNSRSSHSKPVPRGGGLSIVLTFLSAVIFLSLRGVVSSDIAAAIVGGGVLIAGVGLADDLYSVPVWIRGVTHFVGAIWAVWCLGGMAPLDLGWMKWEWGWIGQVVAVLGIVWMTNLYNFMDGIDALGGLEAVSAGALGGFLLAGQGHSGLAELALVLACACGGFLVWNWPPAKIFMGDVGSGFLGFVFGVLVIACGKYQPPFVWTWLILMGVFIVDATLTLTRRVIRGERWYKGHRTHGYQRASQLWRSHAKVTLGVGMVNLVWLFPLAWWATKSPGIAVPLALAALLPLIWIAFQLHAGETEVVREKPTSEVSSEWVGAGAKSLVSRK